MTNEETAAVLRDALELIQQRGWAAVRQPGQMKTLTIRRAIQHATDARHAEGRREAYAKYLAGVNAVMRHIGTGIINWEAGKARSRTQDEVVEMLTTLIARLDK